MTLKPDGPAPYTTVLALTTVLDWYRSKGSGKLTADMAGRVIPASLANRTMRSMEMLDLVDKEGNATDQLEGLRAAKGEEEYRARLEAWVRGVYADVLTYVDPAVDSYEKMSEQFRDYQPAGQREAMAALFMGLWKYAGLGAAARPTSSDARKSDRPRTTRRVAAPKTDLGPPGAAGAVWRGQAPASGIAVSGIPPALVGLLQAIPFGSRWTEEKKASFLVAFESTLDFLVEIGEPIAEIVQPNEEE